ncbi:hypothetical protein [Bacillus sp. T33-2]|uniref:hypothetical protein n=1 Tax=Bacillus sp. T33-2 TaxID=2054168 RepID=UPI000C78D257|nr:hypothetical protein [Bacillus sp. T33-2]PLR99509.1 hypothetical protein CVD19_00165 [Bacillus sp. T33-2]
MRSSQRQKLVKQLVDRFPFLVENYNLLVSYYWQHVEGAKGFDDTGRCSSPEAICRAFRRLVTAGEIVVPEEVKEKRAEYQENFREEYSPL